MAIPFLNCVNYARQSDPFELVPVYLFGVRGVMTVARARQLLDVPELKELVSIAPREVKILPDTPLKEANPALQNIADILVENGVIGPGNGELCRLGHHHEKNKPLYPRILRKVFGLPFEGTHCTGYIKTGAVTVDIVLGFTNKAGEGQFDFVFGGGMEPNLAPHENLRKKAGEKTKKHLPEGGECSVVSLTPHALQFMRPGFASQVHTMAQNIQTIRQSSNGVLFARRSFFSLELPNGIEDELPKKGEIATRHDEVQGFVRVPLKTLLEAWDSGNQRSPYALHRFKHAVPMAIVQFALQREFLSLPINHHGAVMHQFEKIAKIEARGMVPIRTTVERSTRPRPAPDKT